MRKGLDMKKVAVVLCSLLLVFALVGCGDSPAEEPDENGWVEDDYINFMATVQSIADEYIADYKTPWGVDDWKFTHFTEDVVFGMTQCEVKDTSVKQQMVCTFTWKPETKQYIAHYFAVGNTVFLDDGTATPHL